MKSNWSYIKNIEDLVDKMHRIKNNATNAHLITVNVIVLTALKDALGVTENKSISTKKPMKMVQLVLKNNFFWNLIEQFKGQNLRFFLLFFLFDLPGTGMF